MPARSKPLPCEAGIQVKESRARWPKALKLQIISSFNKKHYKYLLF